MNKLKRTILEAIQETGIDSDELFNSEVMEDFEALSGKSKEELLEIFNVKGLCEVLKNAQRNSRGEDT